MTRRKLPSSFIGAIFFLSGASSLVYQVVWQRLLSIHYGVGAISSAVIVSIFMLGLGVGSLLGGFLAERFQARFGHYALLEGLIGTWGLVSLPCLDRLGRATAGSDYTQATLDASLFLLVPTVLMGMTLPVAVKILSRTTPHFVAGLSRFYFVNTIGAAFGAVFASYVLVAAFGLDGATYIAVAINFLLAIAIRRAGDVAVAPANDAESPPRATSIDGKLAYPVIFVIGFLAIGYQIIWFRIVSVLLKDSSYAFATTLGVYLLGIARGSAWVHRMVSPTKGAKAKRPWDLRDLFFAINGAIGASALGLTLLFWLGARTPILAGALRSMARLQTMPLAPTEGFDQTLVTLGLTIAVPMLFLNVPTFLMGASFPLVASLVPRREDAPATAASRAYSTTVLGNVLGGLVTGFVLLPRFGTERTLLGFGCIGLSFFLLTTHFRERPIPRAWRAGGVALAIALVVHVFPGPTELWRAMHFASEPDATAIVEEGTEAVVVTFQKDDWVRNYINGSSHGGRPLGVFWHEAATALAYSKSPKRVLVIGFGTGSVQEIALLDPRVERLTLVEVNATLLRNLEKMPLFRAMLDDRRADTVVDDARRYLQRSSESFDVIMMDPLRTRSALSNNLYSKEFFELAASKLSSSGVMLVWTDEHDIVPRTVATAFPKVAYHECEGYDWAFLVAGKGDLELDGVGLGTRIMAYPPNIARATMAARCPRTQDRDAIVARTSGAINETYRPLTEYYLRPAR